MTYITRLPNTPVGQAGVESLAQLGVDVSHVVYGGQRIGTYYFEPAAGMRAAKVVYDRAGSAYYDLQPGMIPWREILRVPTSSRCRASLLPSRSRLPMRPSRHWI